MESSYSKAFQKMAMH